MYPNSESSQATCQPHCTPRTAAPLREHQERELRRFIIRCASALDDTEKLLLLVLLDAAVDNPLQAAISKRRIASRLGVSKRTADRAVLSLEQRGLLTVRRVRLAKRRSAINVYALNLSAFRLHEGRWAL